MKFIKNRFALAGIAFLLAAIVAVVIFPAVSGSKDATETIMVAAKDIPYGTQITEAMLTEKTIGSYNMPDTLATSKDALVGKYVVSDISAGDFVYTTDVVSDEVYNKDYAIETSLKNNARLVTVSLPSLSAGLAGQIKPGDVVDVVYSHIQSVSNGDFSTEKVITVEAPDLLKNLTIYSIADGKLNTSDKADKEAFIPAVITFVATEAQAAELVRIEYSEDTLHLVYHE